MAGALKVCDKTSGEIKRYSVTDIVVNENVVQLRSKISEVAKVPTENIELIFAGKSLEDAVSICSYGIKNGATIYALKKNISNKSQPAEPLDKASMHQVVTTLQTALTHPAYRNTVEKMLTNPETVDNLIATTPGLENDPIALAMLQDPELLSILANPTHIQSVLESHPCLGQAAMMVAASVNEESTVTRTTTRGNFSLDQMSDDEEIPRPTSHITGDQLAAALAAATSQPSTSQASAPSSNSDVNDFFRQALQAASQNQQAVSESNLQSLRDMGITDEAVARQALIATNGNIEAAVNLIFGDGL